MSVEVPAPSALLTPPQLSKILRELSGSGKSPIGPRPINTACDRGEIAFIQRGSRRYIRWADFESFIAAQRQTLPRVDPTEAADDVARRARSAARARESIETSS